MAKAKRIGIVGTGPGGLTAGMILANRGMDVTIFEKADRVGGRSACINVGPYTFDVGPTLLMMRNVLDDVFIDAGASSGDLLTFQQLDPMYRLQYADKVFDASSDHDKVKEEIKRVFPNQNGSFDKYLKAEKKRFAAMAPCLRMPYTSITDLLHPNTLRAFPQAASTKSVFDVLYGYFKDEELALAFSFQSTYLGMSPWECPGFFAMLSYIEYLYGVDHVKGGLFKISEAMAAVCRKNGAKLLLNTEVRKLKTEGRRVVGVELADGSVEEFDDVIVNADFGYAMEKMVEPGLLKKYSPTKLEKKRLSCSTYMMYMGIDTKYDHLAHNTVVFADSYRKNVDTIFKDGKLPDDFSFYVCNPGITDDTMAPEGHSGLFVLVPTPNCANGTNWEKESPILREKVLDRMAEKCNVPDLRSHIQEEAIISPADWETDYNVYRGAAFNLAHNTMQMLCFRPRNKFEELDCCYLAGGGTHPGSGLPTIYESGRIASNLICDKYGIAYTSHYSDLD
jgi:phytoene desaturase